MCEKCCQLLAAGRWFPLGTPVSSIRNLISSSSIHCLDMTLAVAEALNHNKPKPSHSCKPAFYFRGFVELLLQLVWFKGAQNPDSWIGWCWKDHHPVSVTGR